MDNIFITTLHPQEVRQMIRSELEAFFSAQKQQDQDQDERLTRKDICRLYKISFPTVHEEMKRGLPFEKVGRKTLFRRADVDKYFQAKRAGKK